MSVREHPVRWALGCTFGLLLLGALLASSAVAQNPLDVPGLKPPKVPNPLDLLPSFSPGDAVLAGFKKILVWIFGDFDDLGRSLVKLLLSVPLFADARVFPKLNEYREYVMAGCWGVLGLAAVITTVQFIATSFTGGDVYAPAMGIARAAGAILLLLVFAKVFDLVSRITNEFTHALIVNPIVGDNLSASGKLAAPFAVSALLLGKGPLILIGIGIAVLVLILLIVKVIISALLAVLYVLASLAIAVWPIGELSWALRNLVQAVLVLLMFPVVWATCFGVYVALPADALFSGKHGDTITATIGPLILLATLIVAFKLPFVVLRQAMNAGLMPSFSRGVRNAYLIQRVMP